MPSTANPPAHADKIAVRSVVPCLTFRDQAEAAVNLYVSVFKNAKITSMVRMEAEGQAIPQGKVLHATFELNGQHYTAFDGGPHFKFTEAFSMVATVETQAELDEVWRRLSEGGKEGPCGWLDRPLWRVMAGASREPGPHDDRLEVRQSRQGDGGAAQDGQARYRGTGEGLQVLSGASVQLASERLDATFAALADPTRRAILARLATGEASVSELAEPFAMSQPAISKHLKVLERAGLISRGRDAQRRPRRMEVKPLAEATEWLERYRQMWEANFQRLDALLVEMKGRSPKRGPGRR